MEMIELRDNVFYLTNHSNIGLISKNGNVTFVDTGLDDDTVRKAFNIAGGGGLRPNRVVNTHHHADHCGGNAWLQEKHRVEIAAPVIEAGIIEYPELEPLYLFSGACPPKDLYAKFYKARPSKVGRVIPVENATISEGGLEYVPLAGHSPRQMGVACNGVLFCADSLFPEDVLRKHKIPFFSDIGQQLSTFQRLRETDYKIYVPSHGDPFEDIGAVVDANEQVVRGIADYAMTDALRGKRTTGEVIRSVCDHYGVSIDNICKFYLMNTTVMAYLGYFHGRGLIDAVFDGNQQYWQKK